jgi:hypothetical protein
MHIEVRIFFGFFIEGYVKNRKQNTAVVLKISENSSSSRAKPFGFFFILPAPVSSTEVKESDC